MHGRIHAFVEGNMTIQEFIAAHVPCLPESTVRTHLKAGRNSAHLMLTYSPDGEAARSRGRATQARTGAFRMPAGYGKHPTRFRS